jgi:hypothetical protein
MILMSAFTIIDLIAASTNAFNGALLARRPDHTYYLVETRGTRKGG